jgi:AAA+ superfamily predicted ATPase
MAYPYSNYFNRTPVFSSRIPSRTPQMQSPKFGMVDPDLMLGGMTWFMMLAALLATPGVQIWLQRRADKKEKEQVFKLIKPDNLRSASFEDIIGHERIKKNLKDWARRIEQGLQEPHSVLLTGEPGTGKSMLVRAFANRISRETSLLQVNCEALLEKPETIVWLERDLKKLQKKKKPLVLLMDDIGILGDRTQAVSPAQQSMITRVLKLMDGLGARVAVIGTANNPALMDRAIRNRFPEVHRVPGPTLEERVQQLTKFLKDLNLIPDESVNLQEAASLTDGLTGRRIQFLAQNLRNAIANDEGDLDKKGVKTIQKSLEPKTFNQQQLLEAIEDTIDPTEQERHPYK